MADLRKTISVHMGSDVADPKLGLKFQVTANSKHSQSLLTGLKDFSDSQSYFYISINSTNPQELKNGFEEFLNTATQVAREMSPEVDQMVGESAFEVVASGNHVVAAVNLKKNPLTKEYADLVEFTASSTIKNEAYFQLALLFDRSLTQLLELKETDLDDTKGQFSVELVSNKADKFAIKRKLLELADKFDNTPNNDSDKLAKLFFLMFDSSSFILSSDSKVSFSKATSSQLSTGREKVSEYLKVGKDMYQGNKEMVDSFPFVQAFFDSVESYGNGQITLGIYHNLVSAEVDLFGTDLGVIYRKIVS